MKCIYCLNACVKKGIRNGIQKYQCKSCKKYQQEIYAYGKCNEEKDKMMIELNNEGMGISSIGRFLRLSKTSIVRRLKSLAKQVIPPVFNEQNQVYELDELCTFTHKNTPDNYVYIIYAINRKTKQIMDFVVGKRTKENISKVVNAILKLRPRKIYTDRLNIYPSVIPKEVHHTGRFRTNCIERKNLTLRTHIKRLSRKTICYSKCKEMIESCMFLYRTHNLKQV